MLETLLYIVVASFGYLSFGLDTPDNILKAYDLSDMPANWGRFFVFLQLNMSIPLTVHPGRGQLWALLRLLLRQPADLARAREVSLVALDGEQGSLPPSASEDIKKE